MTARRKLTNIVHIKLLNKCLFQVLVKSTRKTNMILENKRTAALANKACPCSFSRFLVHASRSRRRQSVGGESVQPVTDGKKKRSKSVGPIMFAGPITRAKSIGRSLWGPLPNRTLSTRKRKLSQNEENVDDKSKELESSLIKCGDSKKLMRTESMDNHELAKKAFDVAGDIHEHDIDEYSKRWSSRLFIKQMESSKDEINPKKFCNDAANKTKLCHAFINTNVDEFIAPVATISPFCPVKCKAVFSKHCIRKAVVMPPVKWETEVIFVIEGEEESENPDIIDLTDEDNADNVVYDAVFKELESLKNLPCFSLSRDKKEIVVRTKTGLQTTILRKKIGTPNSVSVLDISSLRNEIMLREPGILVHLPRAMFHS